MQHVVRLLIIAQLSLFFGLLICTVLIPHFLFESNEGGVSNYGMYAKTIVPYTLGFGICGFATLLAAQSVSKTMVDRMVLYPLLVILGILYSLVLVSTYPYKVSASFDQLHQLAGVLLLAYSVGTGIWLTIFKARSSATLLLFFAQLVGFLLAVATYLGFLHMLFIAELVESTAFGALLVVSVARLSRAHGAHP